MGWLGGANCKNQPCQPDRSNQPTSAVAGMAVLPNALPHESATLRRAQQADAPRLKNWPGAYPDAMRTCNNV
eukprot:6292803-Amphidinium_carterae.1